MGKMRLLVVAAGVAALVGVGAGSAFAGEVTGKNKPLWIAVTEDGGHVLHGKSPCAFSGQEDLTGSPLRTQTPHEVWLGPEIGVVNPAPGTPGTACNPNTATEE
jgi:hypothetical protein